MSEITNILVVGTGGQGVMTATEILAEAAIAFGHDVKKTEVAGMAQRCPRAKPLGLARLPRHRFIVNTDGYATVIRDPRESVHGVLWDCTLGDIRTLDKFEDLASGLYVKISQPVIVEGSGIASVFAVPRYSAVARIR